MARVRALMIAYRARPCMDCGIQYPHYVMQLDHRPGETKLRAPNRSQTQASYMREAAKCDVVCANCHAARTWARMQAGVTVARHRALGPTLPFE